MAKYFYVKTGLGTNIGATPFTAAESGAFGSGNLTAANCYANLKVVGGLGATDGPGDGDFVLVSDAHNLSYDSAGNPLMGPNCAVSGIGCKYISVADLNADQYSPGASENLTDTADDFRPYGNGLIAGISLETGDDVVRMAADNTRQWTLQDLTLTADISADYFLAQGYDGACWHLKHCNLNTNTLRTAGILFPNYGVRIILDDVTIGGSGISTKLFAYNAFPGGGGSLFATGCDFTNCGNANFGNIGAAGIGDHAQIKLVNCQVNSAMTLPTPGTDLHHPHHIYEMYGCTDSTDNKLFQYFFATGCGSAENNDSVYVTANDTWYESTDKSSIQIKTSDICGHAMPLRFELDTVYAELSDTAKDKVSINICSDFSLTDVEIAFFLEYPDKTIKATPRWLTSGKVASGHLGTNPLEAGTALNTTGALVAADWTGEPTSPTFYLVELDTVSQAGANCMPKVIVEVYKPDIDGTTGNKLYIDSEIVIGT